MKLLQYVQLRLSSIRGRYGPGVPAFFNAFYYSLLKVNTFVVDVLDLATKEILPVDTSALEFGGPDLGGIRELRAQRELPMEFFCDDHYGGNLCFYALFNGELAAVNWVFRKGEYSRFLILGERDVELNYVFTLPEYRGKGISTALKRHTAISLKELGYERLFTVVHSENIANLKSDKKVGFTVFGTVKSYGRFSRRLVTAKGPLSTSEGEKDVW